MNRSEKDKGDDYKIDKRKSSTLLVLLLARFSSENCNKATWLMLSNFFVQKRSNFFTNVSFPLMQLQTKRSTFLTTRPHQKLFIEVSSYEKFVDHPIYFYPLTSFSFIFIVKLNFKTLINLGGVHKRRPLVGVGVEECVTKCDRRGRVVTRLVGRPQLDAIFFEKIIFRHFLF